MTQYTIICLILYLLTNYIALSIPALPLGCDITPAHHTQSDSYKCPKHCKKSRTNPPDLRRVELNYRICSHPDLTDTTIFKIVSRQQRFAEIVVVSHKHRRKRALFLTPSWQDEPQSMTVNQGSPVEIGCSLSAVSSSVTFEWFYSGTFPSSIGVPLSDPYNEVSDNSGAIVIESAGFKDAGYYQCKVTDDTKDGEHVVYSNIVEIKIETYYLTGPSTDIETVSKVSFQAEDILVLSCPDVDSNPPAIITWYKDNVPFTKQKAFVYPFDDEQTFLYNSETYTVTKNSLVLMSLSSSDDGMYKCRATNSKTGDSFDLKQYNLMNSATTVGGLQDVKPTVLKESPVTVEEGQTVELFCLGVGHPTEMTYSWKFLDNIVQNGGRILISDFGRQVTISNAVKSDGGLYTCSCENDNGDTDTYYNVKVTDPTTTPEITITSNLDPLYFHDVYSDNPLDIFLPCTADGAKQVRFWKDGQLLEASDRYTFDKDGGLEFHSYDSSDSGVYQCVASNAEHWKQKMTFVLITAKVTVNAAADVTRKGADATLTCIVTGYPYPEVSWSHNSNSITNTFTDESPYIVDEPPKHTLVIKQIYFTDSGVYTCTATSQTLNHQPAYSHSASDSVTLTIVQEITMTAAELYVVATVDDTLKLGCTADAKPLPDTVVWSVNGTALNGNNKYSITTKDISDHQKYSELSVSNLVVHDGGTYKCEAQNTVLGNTRISHATITVDVKYLSVVIEENIRSIASGETVTITCSAQGSPKPQQLKWFDNSAAGDVITTSTGYLVRLTDVDEKTTQTVLEIDRQIADQNYVCEATNYLNSVAQFEEAKAILKIYKEIVAHTDTPIVTTDVGESTSLACYCKGVPLPEEAVWKKNDEIVSPTNTVHMRNVAEYDPEFKLTSTLVFDNPVSDDIGVYTCMCTNGYQGNSFTDLATVEFGVVSSVRISWYSDNPNAAQYGEEIRLTCTATGLPLPTAIIWSRLKDDLTALIETSGDRFSVSHKQTDLSNLRSILTFHTTIYSDDGEYFCSANNTIHGQVSSTSAGDTLLIYQNPTIEMGTNELAVAEGSVAQLSCKVSSKPAPTKLEWYFRDNPILLGNPSFSTTSDPENFVMTSTFMINEVTNTEEGKYRCVGYHTYENKEESGENYTYVRIHRPVVLVTSTTPTLSTSVSEHTSLTLTCVARGVPEVDQFQWTIDSVMMESDELTSNLGTLESTTDYTRSDYNIEVKSVLEISDVKYYNLGTYKCTTSQLFNGLTEVVMESFDVSVDFAAKTSSGTGETDVLQEVGSQVRLTCVVFGNPSPDEITWKWAEDDSRITRGDEYSIQNVDVNSYKKQSVLQFLLLPIYHDKSVVCTSKNERSGNSYSELSFSIQMLPDSLTIIPDGLEGEGDSFTLTCLSSFTSGVITWYKHQSELSQSSRILISPIMPSASVNSLLVINDLDVDDDAADYVCEVVSGDKRASELYPLLIGEAVAAVGGLTQGVIIALIVLGIIIFIVLILICIILIHGRSRRRSKGFDESQGYRNKVFDDKLPPMPKMRGTSHENLPRVVEPIILSKNDPEHDVKEATIMRQATLNQQRDRNPNLGKSLSLERPVQRTNSNEYGPPNYTLDHRNKRDWY